MKLRYFWNQATDAGYLLTDTGEYLYNSNCPVAFDGDPEFDKVVVENMIDSGACGDQAYVDAKLQERDGITTADCIEVDCRCQPLEG